jgi:hypothetical protein
MAVIKCPGCTKTFSSNAGLSTHKRYCKHKITAFSKKILESQPGEVLQAELEAESSQKRRRIGQIAKDNTPEIEEEEELANEHNLEELQEVVVSPGLVIDFSCRNLLLTLFSREIPLLHNYGPLDVHFVPSVYRNVTVMSFHPNHLRYLLQKLWNLKTHLTMVLRVSLWIYQKHLHTQRKQIVTASIVSIPKDPHPTLPMNSILCRMFRTHLRL